ncbi:hypothetical protein [Microbulbifer mangrovi]|uniref:hypothetical protein n=1 Tax=Microbulbifer mangrovi TaxID=927787 RepID=UPI00099076AA|nr:hypothetical protein [Microbulbifer mangrovi]
MIKKLISTILLLVASQPSFSSYELNPRLLEKQVLKDPISGWIEIKKNGNGQVIVPANGYKWKELSGESVYLSSKGNVEITSDLGKYKSPDNFGPVAFEQLHSFQIDRFNEKLKNKFGIESNLKHLYHLRVFGANMRFSIPDYFAYDLTLYSDGKKLQYILVCRDYCHNSEPEIVFVEQG